MPLDDYPEMLTAQNISDYLGISRKRVYEFMNLSKDQGGLVCIKIGITKRVAKEDFVEWIRERKDGGRYHVM